MTNIKLKAANPQYSFITRGKVYPVEEIDEDGDYRIYDDDGDEYFVHPGEIGKNNEWEKVSGFDKYDICNGDVVIQRTGEKMIYFNGYAGKNAAVLVGIDSQWEPMDRYEYNLTHSIVKECDIMEVYRPTGNWVLYRKEGDLKEFNCIFKRDERKKMTVEDIERELGYKIAVVDKDGVERG